MYSYLTLGWATLAVCFLMWVEARRIRRAIEKRTADGSGFKSDDAGLLRYVAEKITEDVARNEGGHSALAWPGQDNTRGDGPHLFYPSRLRRIANAIERLHPPRA